GGDLQQAARVGELVNLVEDQVRRRRDRGEERFRIAQSLGDAREIAVEVDRARQRIDERGLADAPNAREPHDGRAPMRFGEARLPDRSRDHEITFYIWLCQV